MIELLQRDGLPVWVNPSFIVSFDNAKPFGSKLYLFDETSKVKPGRVLYVKQSPGQIMELIEEYQNK